MTKSRIFEYDGKAMDAAGWAKELGIKRVTFYRRVQAGRPPEEVFAGGYLWCRTIEWKGERLSKRQWAQQLGISLGGFYGRLRIMSLEQAMTPGLLPHRGSKAGYGRLLTHNGKTQNATLWAKELGLSKQRIYQRLAKMSVAEALTPGYRKPYTAPRKRFALNGENLTIYEWAERVGVCYNVMGCRIRLGGIERAVLGSWERTGRPGKRYTVNGERRTVQELADQVGVSYLTMAKRIQLRGADEAVFGTWKQGRPRSTHDASVTTRRNDTSNP